MEQHPRFDPWTEAARSYDFVLKNPHTLATAAAPWALFAIVVVIATRLWLRYDYDVLGSSLFDYWDNYLVVIGIATFLMRWIAVAGLANTWHRVVLLNEAPAVRFGLPSRRFVRYFLRCLLLGVAVFAPYLAVIHVIDLEWIESDMLYWLANWAPILPIAMIVTRFSLLLPAVAVDEDRMTLRSSWNFTAGSTWRMFIGLAAATYPVQMVSYLVQQIQYFVPEAILGGVGLLTIISVVCLHLAIGALAATYLSFMYQRLVEVPSPKAV